MVAITLAGYGIGLLGLDMLETVFDQPHLRYGPHIDWFTQHYRHFGDPIAMMILFLAAIAVAIGLSLLAGQLAGEGADLRFFPSVGRFVAAARSVWSWVVLVLGGSAVAGFLLLMESQLQSLNARPHGIILPPERLFLEATWGWAIVWLAETVAKPCRPARVAAGTFLFITAVIGSMSLGWVVE